MDPTRILHYTSDSYIEKHVRHLMVRVPR